ncbi:hypothetical protein D9M70_595420 [compost metagenome]
MSCTPRSSSSLRVTTETERGVSISGVSVFSAETLRVGTIVSLSSAFVAAVLPAVTSIFSSRVVFWLSADCA